MAAAGLHQATDADLLALSSARDQRAFAVLVERHFAAVHRVVWRMLNGHVDSEDVAQEAFLRLWRNPRQVKDGKALKGWLMRVASNLVMDRFRARPMQSMEQAEAVPDERADTEAQVERNSLTATIDAAIAGLPDRQRLAMTLVHFEQMTNIAAAEVMEVSVDALESLLARARRALKDKLAPNKEILLAALAAERT